MATIDILSEFNNASFFIELTIDLLHESPSSLMGYIGLPDRAPSACCFRAN